jgi:hypothetical protein
MIRSACILIYRRFIINIFTQYYNHINCNWRKEFYVIYRHNITLAAAVEIYVLVNTINFIIAFKYKCRLNFSWNMETGNYLQTYCNLYVYYDRGILFLVIRNCKSKKDRQHKHQKDKRTNKHKQTTTHTTKDGVHILHYNCKAYICVFLFIH